MIPCSAERPKDLRYPFCWWLGLVVWGFESLSIFVLMKSSCFPKEGFLEWMSPWLEVATVESTTRYLPERETADNTLSTWKLNITQRSRFPILCGLFVEVLKRGHLSFRAEHYQPVILLDCSVAQLDLQCDMFQHSANTQHHILQLSALSLQTAPGRFIRAYATSISRC